MAQTARLLLDKWTDAQANHAATGNTDLDRLDLAIAGITTIANVGGTVTLTDAQARAKVYRLTGTLTSNLTVVVPDREKLALVVNDAVMGAYTVSIKTVIGTAAALSAGDRKWLLVKDASGTFELI